MSTTLHPTKTRLALLQAVADGSVTHAMTWRGQRPAESRWGRRTVTAACRDLAYAGWIRHGKPNSVSIYATTPWVLTDTGRAVLEAHGGKA